ncbi:ROK family protein [Marinilabilia salmonicolor]|uniref:ROK family protein n=1 Tax=Marinilabilia salmonicolor TaxID=989 RepID=UPI00029AE40E|nr:ROK family protein [Marinilabilia salmonicolor]
MKANIAIGVDIGGSHVSCAAVNIGKGEILQNTFFENAVDKHASSEIIIQTWGQTILKTIEMVGWDRINGIGFAMPGPFDYVNGISLFSGETQKYENTYGLNVKEAIKNFMRSPGNIKVRFVNDAAAFAIGEAWVGKASEVKKSVSITIGTGVGSGFIEDGVPVFKGAMVPKDGFIWDLPYQESVADDYFSTRGIVKAYQSLTGIRINGAKEVALEAGINNNEAVKVYHEFGAGLASLLSPWLKGFGAEMLVLGGNVSKAFKFFEPSMKSVFEKEGTEIIVKESELKDKGQILGSSRLMDDSYWDKLGRQI